MPLVPLKTFKLTGSREPEEGIAIIDLDPEVSTFGKVLATLPFMSDFLAGKIVYDRKIEKAYITSRGKSLIYVFNVNQFPYRLAEIELPNCKVAENITFSPDNKKWFISCRMSGRIVEGDVASDNITNVTAYSGGFI